MNNKHLITPLLALVLLAGCSRKVYVPVETTATELRHDTLYINRLWRDSVSRHDSVVVERRGDTVYHTAWRDRYRLRQRVDTVLRTHVDTVRLTEVRTIRQPAAKARSGASRPVWLALAALAAITLSGLWRGCRGSR